MLNILRTFQLGFHRFFSLYYVLRILYRRDRDVSTAPTAQNAPNREKAAAAQRPCRPPREGFHTGRGKRQNRGDARDAVLGRTLHKSPNDATLQLCTPKRELEQFFHPPLLAANYINANISGVL